MMVIVPKFGQQSAGKALAMFGAAVGLVVFVVASGPFATALKSVLAFWPSAAKIAFAACSQVTRALG